MVTAPSVVVSTGRSSSSGSSFSSRPGLMLSGVVVAGMAAAAALGLLVPDLYGDPLSVASMMRGYDVVTLVAAVPTLVLTLVGPLRRSPRAGLLRTGVLVYAYYTYALASVVLGFTPVFLLHVLITAAALAALPLTLAGPDVRPALAQWFPRRSVAVVLGVLAVSLGAMWVTEALRASAGGYVPVGSALVEPANLVQVAMVLDLVVLVPAYGLAAVLLWRRSHWAAVAAAAVLVSGTLHQFSYMIALVFQQAADVPGASWDAVEPVIATVFVAATAALLAACLSPASPSSGGLEPLT